MSATLAVARRSYSRLCCPSPFHPMQLRHILPPVLSARTYSSDVVVKRDYQKERFRIHTLHPSRLRSSDLIDVSLKTRMRVYGPGCEYPFTGLPYGHHFPQGTRGFLYYNSPKAGDPPAAGELRFRLISGNTPASFVQGSDLQFPNGLPWCIPLLAMIDKLENIREHRNYQSMRQLLLDDGLVTPALLETCAAMLDAYKYRSPSSRRIIHSFGQLFHISFDMVSFPFFALSMNQLRYAAYHGIYCEYDSRLTPYLGSALCCFERSNLPQHKGTRTAVIRIVKILSPVTCRYPNYNGPLTLPVEGELVQRNYHRTGLQPRSFNVDSIRYMGLRMLFRDES
ncbi:hypothetical protein PILCRDRAFT_815419 [Piloderma croceum F 1598]|uniref:Uncharacterized protein n=1 Tax=Piloderma croceum (strain F 1598) TaxID=765440 RepID=A0A0C3G8J4_PILCF|nr:hypothetical protein PILCRDRAFT_815419 [Piloderma croceum F 1598]